MILKMLDEMPTRTVPGKPGHTVTQVEAELSPEGSTNSDRGQLSKRRRGEALEMEMEAPPTPATAAPQVEHAKPSPCVSSRLLCHHFMCTHSPGEGGTDTDSRGKVGLTFQEFLKLKLFTKPCFLRVNTAAAGCVVSMIYGERKDTLITQLLETGSMLPSGVQNGQPQGSGSKQGSRGKKTRAGSRTEHPGTPWMRRPLRAS